MNGFPQDIALDDDNVEKKHIDPTSSQDSLNDEENVYTTSDCGSSNSALNDASDMSVQKRVLSRRNQSNQQSCPASVFRGSRAPTIDRKIQTDPGKVRTDTKEPFNPCKGTQRSIHVTCGG